ISLKDCLSEEGIDIIGAIGDVKLGDIMGMTYCADPDCTDHLDGEGWYDADGYIIGDDVAGQIMKGLYEKTFNDLTNGGLDMAELTDGIYFGTALGYEIGTTTNAGYCAKDCTNAEEGHEHNFYWVDENGDFVGELENAISNIALKDCMGEEGVDIIGAIGDVKVGAIMGMTYCADPDCPDHVDGEGWYDADGYIVGDDISGRIMKGLYEKTFDELSNGELDFTELTKGIYLGEALGYTKCGDGCEISHVHRQDRWYTLNEESGEYEYVGDLNNEISKISIEELMGDEGVDINEIIGGVTLGGLMGAYYCDGVGTECYIDAPMHAHSKGWYDADGEFLSTDDASGDMANKLYELTVDELLADDFDFTTITEGIYLGRTFGYEIGEPINRNYCDKDCANDGFDHTHKYSWYDVDGKYVGDMDNAISNIELNTFLDSEEEGSIDFTEILADVKVGFVLGMTYCDGKDCELDHTHLTGWYGSDGVMVGDDVSGTIMSGLYELTFSELTGGAFDITTLTDGIYFGKALGYVKCVQGCTIDHGEEGHLKECEKSCKLVHNHTYDGKWYNEDGEYVGAMDNAISNISLKDCFEGNFDITTALNDVKLGEMMDMVYCGGSDETCHIKHPISNGHAGGWYELNEYGEYEKVMANDLGEEIMLKVYGLTYGEITESGIDFASITDGIYFGKALGYKQCTGNTGCPLGKEHNHATGKWFKVDAVTGKATYVGEMDNAIANIALSDAMQGKVDIDATINGIKLGEIMGKTRVENAGVVTWYDVNGNEIVFDNLSGSDRILYQMYDNTLEEFRRGDFSIETVFNGMYVGHVMGYKGGVDAWTKADGSSVTNLEMVMADIRMDDLINDRVNFQNIINGLKLGDVISGGDSAILNNLQNVKIGNLATEIDKLSIGKLMGYEERADGWYNNGVKVTGVYGALSKYSIGELTSGTINFDSFKVSEVINVGDSAILKLLADKTIGEAATAADNLLLGDVMGYTKQAQSGYCQVNCNEAHTHKFYWVKGGVPASKIAAKIANYTVAGVSDGLDNLTVGDVVDTSTGVFKIMETEAFTANGKTYAKVNSADEVPIDEIGARATEGVKNATYAELVGAGISLLTTQTEDSITNFYTVIYPTINLTSPVENWQQTKTLTQVITDIINTLNLIMQSR
ncbi:MAG: hypothetical protein J6R88_00500, partial [Clostridia bacterium]|nr:hypothetical protein [Clostridia bacterium]